MADVSKLKGEYILGIAIKKEWVLQLCPQFKISLLINN